MTEQQNTNRNRVVRNLRTYRTPSTLLFQQAVKRKQLRLTPVFALVDDGIRAEPIEEYIYQSFDNILKLSAYNDSLHVIFGAVRVERMLPQWAGLLVSHLDPVFFPEINAFLDQHFSGVETAPATPEEYAAIDDISFYDNATSKEEKMEVIDMAVRIISLAFPVASTFYVNRVNDGYYEMSDLIDSKPRAFHYARDYRSYVTKMFGVYRKDLAKAVASATPKQAYWASLFTDIVPIDYAVDVLRQKLKVWDLVHYDMSVLAEFPLRVIKALMLDQSQLDAAIPVIEDALEMASFIPHEERKFCVTWQELHDRGMAHYQMVNSETGQVEFGEGFEGFFSGEAPVEGYSIVPLRTVNDFIDTGKQMDVCVGSTPYVRRAFAKEGFCFRLDSAQDSPYALFEVRKKTTAEEWYVTQAAGHNNGSLPTEIKAAVASQLEQFIPLGGR